MATQRARMVSVGHSQHGDSRQGLFGRGEIGDQSRFERGVGELVHTQGAKERVGSDAIEVGLGTHEDAALGAGEQLVSTAGDEGEVA